jgi:hypothetical protein
MCTRIGTRAHLLQEKNNKREKRRGKKRGKSKERRKGEGKGEGGGNPPLFAFTCALRGRMCTPNRNLCPFPAREK